MRSVAPVGPHEAGEFVLHLGRNPGEAKPEQGEVAWAVEGGRTARVASVADTAGSRDAPGPRGPG